MLFSAFVPPSIYSFSTSLIRACIQQVFIEYFLGDRRCFRCLGYVSEQNEDSYLQGVYSIVKGQKTPVNIKKFINNELIMLVIVKNI